MKIAVVGGGIGGLVGGFLAAEAGHEVTVFEKDVVGSGASGRALGVLVPITGLDRPIDRMQQNGIAAWPELAKKLAAASGMDVHDFWKDWGNGRQQVRLPLLFVALAKAIVSKSGQVMQGEAVDSPARLKTDFDRVVLSAGLGNVDLAHAKMKVSAGVACRMRGELSELITADNLFICPDWDGTILAGSENWEMPEAGDGTVPEDKLAALLARVETQVHGLELVEAWVGYRPVEAPRMPLVKEIGDGIFAVTGLGKVGIGVSPMLRFYE